MSRLENKFGLLFYADAGQGDASLRARIPLFAAYTNTYGNLLKSGGVHCVKIKAMWGGFNYYPLSPYVGDLSTVLKMIWDQGWPPPEEIQSVYIRLGGGTGIIAAKFGDTWKQSIGSDWTEVGPKGPMATQRQFVPIIGKGGSSVMAYLRDAKPKTILINIVILASVFGFINKPEEMADELNKIKWGLSMPPLFRLIHDQNINCEANLGNGTLIAQGSDVFIKIWTTNQRTITTFIVNGINILPEHEIWVKNVQGDIHISKVASDTEISLGAGIATFLPISTNCPQEPLQWTMQTVIPNLSINPTTGLVTGTIPSDYPSGKYDLTITVQGKTQTVTRNWIINVEEPPAYGLVWMAKGKIDGTVQALVEGNNGVIFLGTSTGKIFRTTDFSTYTQSTLTTAASTGGIKDLIRVSNGKIAAISPSQVYFSTDNTGITFTLAVDPPSYPFCEKFRKIKELPDGKFYVCVRDDYERMMLLNSSGVYLRRRNFTTPGLNGWTNGIYIIDTNIAVFIAGRTGGIRIGRTTDQISSGTEGSNSIPVVLTLAEGGINSWPVGIFRRKNGSLIFSCSIKDGSTTRIYYSNDDGINWNLLSTFGLVNSLLRDMIGLSRNVILMACGHIYRSTDGGVTFTDVFGPDGSAQILLRLSNQKIVCGTNGATTNIYLSEA